MSAAHPEYIIRPASLADAAAIAELAEQLGYPSTEEDIFYRLTRILPTPDHRVFVAESSDGSLLGWVYVFAVTVELLADRLAEVGGLVIDNWHRRSGIGHALLAAAEEWARQRDLGCVRIHSNIQRQEAPPFYLGAGYLLSKIQNVFIKEL
jgi:predicted N-acetyltransferase YhbS